jgi:hypothetical protein
LKQGCLSAHLEARATISSRPRISTTAPSHGARTLQRDRRRRPPGRARSAQAIVTRTANPVAHQRILPAPSSWFPCLPAFPSSRCPSLYQYTPNERLSRSRLRFWLRPDWSRRLWIGIASLPLSTKQYQRLTTPIGVADSRRSTPRGLFGLPTVTRMGRDPLAGLGRAGCFASAIGRDAGPNTSSGAGGGPNPFSSRSTHRDNPRSRTNPRASAIVMVRSRTLMSMSLPRICNSSGRHRTSVNS